MRYIHRLLLTGSPAFVLFLRVCLFLVSSDSVPCIYLEPVVDLVLHAQKCDSKRPRCKGVPINCHFGRNTWITLS